MTKNTLLIRLMTLFMAIVGLNAAVLVGYILIYPQFNGDFSRKNIPGDSPGIVSAQADNFHEEAPFISSENDQNNIPIFEGHTEEIVNNTSSENFSADYSSVKQTVFEDLAHREELSGGQEQQILLPEENDPNDAISQPAQATQESYTTMQEYNAPSNRIENSYSPEQNSPQGAFPSSSEMSSANFSGNADNFYTHDNPHLQQTAYAFVLNTSSKKFHLPSCNDVRRMSEENYATSNSSFYDLEAQGYQHCKHCLKNYISITSGGSSDNTYASNSYDNSALQQDTETSGSFTDNGANNTDSSSLQQDASSFAYIINTSDQYFHIPNGCKYINYYSKPEDCISTNSTREELISQGYRPCHFCFG